jgi:hypothetical protein
VSGATHDAAWVIIDTPLPPDHLAAFCEDLERLYRINPYLEFRHWRAADDAEVEAAYRNLSNGQELNLRLRAERRCERSFRVHYDRGIKRSTHFEIAAAPAGSRLTITDRYDANAAGEAPDVSAVDRSLHAWGVALREYLQRERRWGRVAPWRWYMRRVWLPMKPSARRITFIILLVTLAELALFGLVMAIYWVEYGR